MGTSHEGREQRSHADALIEQQPAWDSDYRPVDQQQLLHE